MEDEDEAIAGRGRLEPFLELGVGRAYVGIDGYSDGQLRALGRANGCTLFMVMLSGFYVLLQRYAGRDDLVVLEPVTPTGAPSRER